MYLFIYIWFWQGDLYDHESLVKAIKQVDVVISTVGHGQLADQTKIIAAIKEAGNVKVKKQVISNFGFCTTFSRFMCARYEPFILHSQILMSSPIWACLRWPPKTFI